MSLAAFTDNFDNLDAWEVSNFEASSNEAKGTTGGTVGLLYKELGVLDNCRVAFDIIPDTGDTEGRYLFVGQYRNHSGKAGTGVAYIAGTGICTCGYYNALTSIDDGTEEIIVADEDIEEGDRFHIQMSLNRNPNTGSCIVIVQVYKANSTYPGYNFVGGRGKTLGSAYATYDRVGAISNSDVTTISRFGFQPEYATHEDFLEVASQTMVGVEYYPTTTDRYCSIMVPGGSCVTPTNGTDGEYPPVVAMYFHGASAWSAYSPIGGYNRDASINTQMSIVFAFMRAGIPVFAPSCYNETSDDDDACWGSNDALAEAKFWMSQIREYYGEDTKFILIGYSMGGLLANRLVAEQEEENIVGLYLSHAVCDLVECWKNESWRAGFEAAWGIDPADEAEARSLLADYDPMTMASANASGYNQVQIVFTNVGGEDGDPSVEHDLHSVPLMSVFDSNDIPYRYILRGWGLHSEPLEPGRLATVLQQLIYKLLPYAATVSEEPNGVWGATVLSDMRGAF